jgi:hypothetical protein
MAEDVLRAVLGGIDEASKVGRRREEGDIDLSYRLLP